MSKFKGTRGEVFGVQFMDIYVITNVDEKDVLDFSEVGEEIATINKNLIVDAFKVRQQINCELSELLENFNSAISLLKQTTEFEVLQSFRDKVSILEKVKDNGKYI